MVSASHNPAEDNGLKVLDANGLKLDDAIEDELEQLIWRTEELGSVAQRRDRPGGRWTRRCSSATGSTGSGSPRSIDGGGPADRPRLRERLRRDRPGRRSSPRPGRRSRSIHNEPDGVNINVASGATAPASLAARGRRARRGRRLRPRRRRRPAASRSTRPARSSTATSCWASSRSTASRGASCPRARSSSPSCQQRRAPGGGRGGRRPGRPDARRRQVHPRGDAGLGRRPGRREERPRDRPRAHDLGRRDRHRARGPPGHDPDGRADRGSRRPASRCCRSSSARSGPVTRTSGRAIRPPARDPRRRAAARRRTAGSSSGRPGRSPRCG